MMNNDTYRPFYMCSSYQCHIPNRHQEQAVEAFRELVLNRRDPDMYYQVLDRFRNRGLIRSADYLHSQI